MGYKFVKIPAQGEKIRIKDGKLQVPEQPVVPFIEGDGTGRDIWRASVRVMDAAVQKAYGGKRKIHWMEVYAGEKAFDLTGSWLPDETMQAFEEYLVGIKGPLTTPIGGRYPLAECGAAQGAGPVRVPETGALPAGSAVTGEAPGIRGHGGVPREHGRHLHRDRVRERDGGKSAVQANVQGSFPAGIPEDSLPRVRRAGIEAGVEGRHGEIGAGGAGVVAGK